MRLFLYASIISALTSCFFDRKPRQPTKQPDHSSTSRDGFSLIRSGTADKGFAVKRESDYNGSELANNDLSDTTADSDLAITDTLILQYTSGGVTPSPQQGSRGVYSLHDVRVRGVPVSPSCDGLAACPQAGLFNPNATRGSIAFRPTEAMIGDIGSEPLISFKLGSSDSLPTTGVSPVGGGNAHLKLNKKVVRSTTSTPLPAQLDPVNFSLSAGEYNNVQNLTLSASDGATILYKKDGMLDFANYSGPIAMDRATTIQAYAVKSGFSDSEIGSRGYTFQVATPQPNIGQGSYSESKTIVLSSATDGVQLQATMDGSDPDCRNSNESSVTLTLHGVTTVKAVACREGFVQSETITLEYDINYQRSGGPYFYTSDYTTDCLAVQQNQPWVNGAFVVPPGSFPTCTAYADTLVVTGESPNEIVLVDDVSVASYNENGFNEPLGTPVTDVTVQRPSRFFSQASVQYAPYRGDSSTCEDYAIFGTYGQSYSLIDGTLQPVIPPYDDYCRQTSIETNFTPNEDGHCEYTETIYECNNNNSVVSCTLLSSDSYYSMCYGG